MAAETAEKAGGRRLNTWKEIASFFGRDERTVKRWEAQRGLPVRRLPNGSRSTVFAYEHDLTAWLERGEAVDEIERDATATVAPPEPERRAGDPKGAYAVAAVVAVAALCALMATIFLFPRVWPTRPPHVAPSIAARRVAPDAEAAAFYRAGVYEWQTRTPTGLNHAVDDFTQAIVHDPLYAEAYAGLANAYNLLREFSTMPPEESFPRAKAAAERAIALDPSLAQAHAALAFVDVYWSHNQQAARREFARALALEPRNATAHHWYATFLMATGDFAPALAEIDKAEALDPESTAILADRALILFHVGHRDEAVALLQRIEQTEPHFYSAHSYLAWIDELGGDNSGFVRESAAAAAARNDADGAMIAQAAAHGLDAGGRSGMLRAIAKARRQLYTEGRGEAFNLAESYAAFGDVTDAMAWLRISVSRHEQDLVGMAIDPWFASLHGSKEFRDLVTQASVPLRS